MKLLIVYFLVYSFFENVVVESSCKIISYKRTNNVFLTCSYVKNFQKALDLAKANTTSITISDSTIPNIPGHSFTRFSRTLVTLDIHESGIQTIDSQAFISLTNLQKLILWGNKITWVPADWFVTMFNLVTLDLSFNEIAGIDYSVFQMLPKVQDFYFDYNRISIIDFNMFSYMGNLKRVKFGKNPLRWPYRARLTWQMENQKVSYTDEWEEWSWMSDIIKDCIESGQGEIPSDKVLDCAVEKLLDFATSNMNALSNDTSNSVGCDLETKRLVQCMRPKDIVGNTDYQTVRMILQDYSQILPPLLSAQSPFPTILTN